MIAVRRRDGSLRHDARPRRRARRRRRDHRGRHRRGAAGARAAVRASRSRCRLRRSRGSRRELVGARRRRRSSSSARRRPSTATTRRTSRCGRRGTGRPPREIARGARGTGAAALADVERAEVAGPGLPQPPARRTRGSRRRSRRSSRRATAYGARLGRDPQRIQVELVSANPTGPDHRRLGAERRLRRLGRAAARIRGPRRRARVLLQRRRRQIDRFRESVEARRRGEEPPEDGYKGAYVDEIAARDGDPVELMMARDPGGARARSASTSTRGRARRSSSRRSRPRSSGSRRTRRRARCGLGRRAYGDDKDRPLVRSSDGGYLYFAADVAYLRDKLTRGFDRRSTCSAPTTTATSAA